MRMSSDDYRTDRWLLELIGEAYDPCTFRSLHNPDYPDGLTCQWPVGRVFINPPYSNPKPWIVRGISHQQKGGSCVMLLLKHDSSTEAYRLLHEAGAHFLMINGRLKHETGIGAAFPSVLAVLEVI